LTVAGENVILPFVGDELTVQRTLTAFCGGSLYTYEDTLREGYLPLPYGCRLGVAGVLEGRGIRTANALVLRIPRLVCGCAAPLVQAWREDGCTGGILVIAPPGGGKTTILKDFIREVSRGMYARRVAVVDTRHELCSQPTGALADVLGGYARDSGMLLALRSLSPQVIVLDEISPQDVGAILAVANGGVPIVASIHGEGASDVLGGEWLAPVLARGVFRHLCAVRREHGEFKMEVGRI
jgi:stage III sporulation protein AA